MKRKLIGVILMAVMVCSLAACGSKETKETQADADKSGTPVLRVAMECGYDTDCNGATVGSIMGIMIGAKNIPESWKNNVTGILRTGVSGFYQVSIEELTRRTCAIIDKK